MCSNTMKLHLKVKADLQRCLPEPQQHVIAQAHEKGGSCRLFYYNSNC